jgi:hypothetical protein
MSYVEASTFASEVLFQVAKQPIDVNNLLIPNRQTRPGIKSARSYVDVSNEYSCYGP